MYFQPSFWSFKNPFLDYGIYHLLLHVVVFLSFGRVNPLKHTKMPISKKISNRFISEFFQGIVACLLLSCNTFQVRN